MIHDAEAVWVVEIKVAEGDLSEEALKLQVQTRQHSRPCAPRGYMFGYAALTYIIYV